MDAPAHLGATYPTPDGLPRVLRDFELYRPVGLALYDCDTVSDAVPGDKISYFQTNEIAAAQLAVDRKVEQSQIPEVASQFEASTDGPDLLWEQRAFLANEPSLVPRTAILFDGGEFDLGHEFSLVRPSRSRRQHCADRRTLDRDLNVWFQSAAAFDDATPPQDGFEPKAVLQLVLMGCSKVPRTAVAFAPMLQMRNAFAARLV